MTPILQTDHLLKRLHLLPYQSAFAANDSRFKIGLWARQTGKDHTATAEAVIDCLTHPGTTWIILAASERQALESLAKAKDWAEILKFHIDEYIESAADVGQVSGLPVKRTSGPLSPRLTSAEIKWSNGSRLLALPANPQTIRGYSANLILTEFAFHEDPDAIWRAIYPSISNPLRGGLKKLRIISTPNGLTNKFADLWFNAPGILTGDNGENRGGGRLTTEHADHTEKVMKNGSDESLKDIKNSCSAFSGYSVVNNSPPFPLRSPVQKSGAIYFKSRVTIHDAIASGLPLDAAELQTGLNDPEAWSQEYLCEFMDSSTVMFPYDLIAPCESEQATENGLSLRTNHSPLLFAGIDFGRKHHLTVCWILEALPVPSGTGSHLPSAVCQRQMFVTREVLTIKNTSTPEQIEILRPRLQRCRRVCLDYTGSGVGLGDYLVKEFGDCSPGALTGSLLGPATRPARTGKVELCQFTTALKSELFPRLRAAFEQRLLRIPISREIREDLHAIQRCVTHSGQITYRAPNTADGHSDRTTALALALRAASIGTPVSAPARSIFVPGRTANLRWSYRSPRWRRSLKRR